jgi:integral membrane sensor domain MASE1
MLLVAPAALVLWPAARRRDRVHLRLRTVAEIAAIAGGLLTVTLIIFFRVDDSSALHYFYAILPFLAWSVLRFKDRGAVLASVLLAVTTIALTIKGVGPFAVENPPLADRSLAIQVFLAVFLFTHLALGVILAERDRTL